MVPKYFVLVVIACLPIFHQVVQGVPTPIADDDMQNAYDLFSAFAEKLYLDFVSSVSQVNNALVDNVYAINETLANEIELQMNGTAENLNYMLKNVKDAGGDVSPCEGLMADQLEIFRRTMSEKITECSRTMLDLQLDQLRYLLTYAVSHVDVTITECVKRDFNDCIAHGVNGSCNGFVISNLEKATTRIAQSYALLKATSYNQLLLDFLTTPCYQIIKDQLEYFPKLMYKFVGSCTGVQSRQQVPNSCLF